MLGATSFAVLADYARRLAAGGGRLYLSGVDPGLAEQIERSGHFDLTGPTTIFEADPALGASTARALEEAGAWLVSGAATPTPESARPPGRVARGPVRARARRSRRPVPFWAGSRSGKWQAAR